MNICPFCDPENINRQKLFETETEYVFYNIRNSNKGRCLVVPKRHVENIRELNNQELESLMKTVKMVSEKLNDYLHPDGFNYGFNEGVRAGQTTEHFHFHILPRWNDDNVMEYHLFHGDPKTKSNLSPEDFKKMVEEFKKIFI